MPPNTDHAHNNHNWTIIRNFDQVQVVTPWWWILCDPKHVGVIFNVCLLDFYITQILTSMIVLIECISRLIKVTNTVTSAALFSNCSVIRGILQRRANWLPETSNLPHKSLTSWLHLNCKLRDRRSTNHESTVAARSKAWVCCRSPAGISGSDPVGDVDVRFLWMLCVVRQRSLRGADHSSRGVLPSVVCLSVIMKHW